jgi:uncharacterized membrane protein HdeD (DUF308 family)
MSDYPINPADSAGPNNDGGKALAKESKWGLATTFLLFAAAQGLVDALTKVDLNGQTGWWVSLANAGVATAIGTITAWLKRNR